MAVIDDKVVSMSFESSKFESGVHSTVTALDKLKAALKLPGASKGLEDVGAATKKIDLSHIGKSVDAVVDKLNYFSVASLAIFSNVAIKAVQAGAQITKALTLDPILQGFKEYETQINAIQVILSNTAVAGTKLKDVTAVLDELNEYADQTIYNFTEMTRNIGMFTAAGVDLETSAASIKGIANMAALSGSSANQAATAMYQLSQAISAGKVQLMDWRSVENASMGSATFKRALAETALHMGTLKDNAVAMVGPMKNVTINGLSFRASLASKPGEDSWLTSDVLTTTLKQLSGDMTDAELAAEGYTKAQIKNIQTMATTALEAATTVKTLTQLVSTTKEQLGSGWAKTWAIIFGDFGEAKKLFTGLSHSIGGFVSDSADARNKVLQDWKDLGGRTLLIDSIGTAFHNLGMVLKPIKEAFRDIFPAKTGKDLMSMTQGFAEFVKTLKPSVETMENLKRTFAGIFAALSIGKQILFGIFTVFKEIFSVLGGGSGGFLNLTGSIGDFVVAIDAFLKEGNRLHNFFVGLGKILAKPVEMLSKFAGAIGDVLGAISGGGISTGLIGMTEAATPLQVVLEALARAWDSFSTSVKNSVDMEAILESIGTAISGIGTAIGNAASSMNFDAILQVIRTGLFVGLVVMFKKFLGKGSLLGQITQGFGSGIISNISGIFSGLSGSMQAMQTNIKAKTLKEIAIAIALLAASVVALSFVDPAKLNQSLAAIGIMMGELLGAMAIMDKITATGSWLKLPVIAAGLILLAGAIDILVIAVFALSKLSWDELLKGLGGVAALLVGITAAAVPLSANSAGMIRAGVGITAIAIGMNLLALAVRQMGSMDLADLAKGLGGVAGALLIMANAMKVMPKGMILQAAALIALAVGLKILASAVAQFGSMSLASMGKGLLGIGGALVVIAGAMHLMPKGMVLQAAALLLVSLALGKIGAAVQSMGGMSITQIAKGLGTLAGSLAILAAALYLMTGTLAGAAALAVAAAGLAMLTPAILALGKMSWGSILKGMVALAAALTIIGVAGALITPAIPALLGLGLALVLVGAGLALAGVGILAISAGISALLVALPSGVGILIAALQELTRGLIENAKLFALGILEVANSFAAIAPKFVAAIVKILSSVIDAIIRMSPKIVELFGVLIDSAVQILHENQGKIIAAGMELLLALLQGIKNNIVAIVTMVVEIITIFLRTISDKLGDIIKAGLSILVSLIKGIVGGYALVITTVLEIITKFLATIASNLGKLVTAGLSILTSLLKGIASRLGDVVKAGTDIIVAYVKGIADAGSRIVTAAREAAGSFINTLAREIVKLADEVFTAMITLMNGLARVIEQRAPEMRAAGARIGIAIIEGLTGGVLGAAGDLYNTITNVMDHAMGLVKKIPLIGSPSKVTTDIGMYIIQGLVKGIEDNKTNLYSSAEEVSNGLIKKFNDIFQTNSPSRVMMEIGQWVGEGFVQGLKGSQEDIRSVFAELNQKLTEAITTARETILSEQKKLKELLGADKQDMAAIKEAQSIIKENQNILTRSIATREVLRNKLKDERLELIKLSGEYARNNQKIDEARQLLQGLIQDKKAFIESTTAQYSNLPEIQTTDAEGNALTPEQQVANYLEALKIQAAAVATYQTTLDELRKLGLDDETYEKLLAEGTADQAFATQLLAGGKTAVEALNKLDKQLMDVSKSLAISAAKNLKQAGIDAANGLLLGLMSRRAKIKQEMSDMIDDLVAEVRRKLHLRSPSRVFMEIGMLTMQGLADGFTKSSKLVTNAMVSAIDDALSTMKSSMSKISDIVTNELNPNPVITPILDLSQVRSQMGVLTALTNVTPITAAASYGQASMISSAQIAAQMEEMAKTPVSPTVTFEQNNYSPKALTDIEIYRQTRNQLSQIKSALAIP